jgi:hypothetical protein
MLRGIINNATMSSSMSNSRFFYNPIEKCYMKRILFGGKCISLKVPPEIWSHTTSNAIGRWLQKINLHTIEKEEFMWGIIDITKPSHFEINICPICQKQYYSRSGLFRHKKECKEMNIASSTTSSSSHIPQPTTTTQTFVQNNTNIVINNNIELRNYGDENPNWLTTNILYQVIGDLNRAIPKLMEKKHFNDEFPENKNLRLHTRKDVDKILQVFENGRWRVRNSKQIFYRVIVDIYDVLSEALTEQEEDDQNQLLTDDIRKARRTERFIKKIERIRPIWDEFEERIQSADKSVMDELWNDLKVLLMDRHLAIEQGYE